MNKNPSNRSRKMLSPSHCMSSAKMVRYSIFRPDKRPVLARIYRKLNGLYQKLHSLDVQTGLPWSLAIVSAIVTLMSAILLLFSFYVRLFVPSTAAREKVDSFFYHDCDFAYIPQANVLITTAAKVGSTTLWTWLYRGVTGKDDFECTDTYIQNFEASCWHNQIVRPENMTSAQRWKIVHDPKIFRIAITRDPFERLLSAWKSKVACESDDYGTDVEDRDIIVPKLLNQADVERQSQCLSLNGFAKVLERIRIMYLKGQFEIKYLNKHFRPQEFHFDYINYDIVLNVKQVSNKTLLEPLVKRLKFSHLLKDAPPILHRSPQQLTMLEETAVLLYRFAALTEPFPPFVQYKNT